MKLLKGEIRQVGIEVVSQKKEDFIIELAKYEVVDSNTKESVVAATDASIDGHKVICLFTASTVGKFDVIFTYNIKAEVIKSKVSVEVI